MGVPPVWAQIPALKRDSFNPNSIAFKQKQSIRAAARIHGPAFEHFLAPHEVDFAGEIHHGAHMRRLEAQPLPQFQIINSMPVQEAMLFAQADDL